MARKSFYLYSRSLKSGKNVFYFRAYRPNGTLTPWRSTGAETEEGALEYCYYRKALGTLHEPKRTNISSKIPTFGEYFRDWWLWLPGEDMPLCPLTSRKIRRKKKHSGRDYCSIRRQWLKKHLLPTFGPTRIDNIQVKQIERWLDGLAKKDLASSTIDKIFGQLKLQLSEAVRLGDIPSNPADSVEGPSVSHATRDVLSKDELRTLFFDSEQRAILWEKRTVALGAALVAFDTGARLSEVRALRAQDFALNSENGPMVQINTSLSFDNTIKQTKTGRLDRCAISQESADVIELLISANYKGDGFVFSNDSGISPASKSGISSVFNKVLNEIGIDEKSRKARGLVFHSLRHGFVSAMNGYGLRGLKHAPGSQAEETYIHNDADRARSVAETWFEDRKGSES